MMKILYDHQMFSIQRYGGISRYFANLYHFLNKQEDVEVKLGVLHTRNYYIQNEKRPLPNALGKWLLKKDNKLYKWNKRYSRRLVKLGDFDIFHPTYYHPYFLPHIKKPFVITVHDMIYELFPEFFPGDDIYIPNKRKIIERADHIIAISESTKRDIQQLLQIKEDKITVVYHGYYEDAPGEAVNYTPPFDKYILFVGDRYAYKNFNRFIKAVAPILHSDSTINLICTGGGKLLGPETELLYRNRLENRAMQVSATDKELKVLYKKALVFVFPSLYEGFGFPILEAFNSKCPAVTSNTSCFKEVGGDAVIYFDPYDIDQMRTAISTVINNNLLADDLREKGADRLKLFTIEKCVEQTKEVYRKMLKS
jgi:glycosyltransferase involved in cell wall biosynthesis